MKTSSFLLASLLLGSLVSGCGDGVFCHRAEGADETRTLTVPEMTGIELMISGDVTLHQGDVQEVKVTGASNIIDLIETDVDGGIWKIKTDGCTRGKNDLDFEITLPSLTYAGIAGSGSIYFDSAFVGLETVKLSIAGSGDITAGLEATRVETEIAGSGDIQLSGSCTTGEHSIAGSGKIQAFDLSTTTTDASIAGSGTIEVNVSTSLDASISGSGDIFYKGTPAVTTHVTGSGNVIHKD